MSSIAKSAVTSISNRQSLRLMEVMSDCLSRKFICNVLLAETSFSKHEKH